MASSPAQSASPTGKPEPKKSEQVSEKGSPLGRIADAAARTLIVQDRILNRLEGIHNTLKELCQLLQKKTGIFEIATRTENKKQQSAPQQKAELPEDLNDLSQEDREKLILCPGGIKLKHYYPDKRIWGHMNFDVLEPKGYKWKKDEKESKNSHWEKGE